MKFNNKLISNFSYLSFIQIVTLFIPFIYYPYLIRKYDITEYGLIIFIQSTIMLFSIIVDFGFSISGTRIASENRDNIHKLSLIYSSITIIKLFLFLLCFLIYQVFIHSNDTLNSNKSLSNYLFFIILGEALFPQWLYLGLEKIKFAALINLLTRIFLLFFIFLGSNSFIGFYSFPTALILSSLLNGIISLFFVYYRLGLRFKKVSLLRITRDLSESYSFLLSRSVGIIILKLNSFLIGNYIGLAQVAYYDLAEKLINLALLPLNILNQVLYPHIARVKNFRLTFNVIYILLPAYILIYPIVYLVGERVIILFAGKDMVNAFSYLMILYLIPITSTITYFTGNCALILIDKKKEFNNSIYFSAIIFFITILILIQSQSLNVNNLCLALVLNSITTCLLRVFYCLKYKSLFI